MRRYIAHHLEIIMRLRPRLPLAPLLLVCMLGAMPTPSWAQNTYTWKATATTGQWTGNNWAPSGGGGEGSQYAGYPGLPVFSGLNNPNPGSAVTDRAVINSFAATLNGALGLNMGSGATGGTNGGLTLASIDFNSSSGNLTISNSATNSGYVQLGGSTINSVDRTLIAVRGSSDLTFTKGSGVMDLQLGITNGVFQVATDRTLTVGSSITQASSNSGFTAQGGGTMILTGDNTVSGAYSGVSAVASSTTLQVGNGGTTGTLGSGDVTNNGTLTFNRSNAYSVSNVISGSGGVVQAGTGTTTLSGVNTYTGATKVNAGTLLVNGNQSSATGALSVESGGLLGGTGTLGGATTVKSGGGIRGDSGTGTGALAVGNVTITNGGNLLSSLSSVDTNGSGTSSKLNVGSNLLNLETGSVLKLSKDANFSGTTGGTFTLATISSGGGFQLDSTTRADGYEFGSYVKGSGASGAVTIDPTALSLTTGDKLSLQRSGNDLVLVFTPVPEPASLLAACGLAAGGVALVRRLRRKATPADLPTPV